MKKTTFVDGKLYIIAQKGFVQSGTLKTKLNIRKTNY